MTSVVHVADCGDQYPGSFVPMIRTLAERGRPRKYEIELILPERLRGRRWADDLNDKGVSVSYVPESSRGELARFFRTVIRNRPPNAIFHTHFSFFDVPVATAALGIPHRRVVWHVHSPLQSAARTRIRNTLRFGIAGRTVHGIICVASHLVPVLLSRGAPSNRIHVIHNGIDPALFPLSTPEARVEARARLGIPSDARVVLHLGWDWIRKGGDVLVESLAKVSSSRNDVLVATVGGGEAARAAAREAGLDDRVLILEPVDRPADLYTSADVFVAPSRAEGAPFALLEAMCCGTPVVASDIDAHRDRGALPGTRLVRLEPTAFASAIADVLAGDPAALRTEAVAARRWVIEHASVDAWAAEVLDMYDGLER